jgi:hypothetical protein
MAIQNDILENVSSPEEIFTPTTPLSKAHRLIIKESKHNLIVLRQEEYIPGEGHRISSSKALT